MGILLASNISAMRAKRQLDRSSSELGQVSERLSSGLRINRPSDDAAGLAVSSTLASNARVFNQSVRNINDGLSLLGVAEGALQQLSSITQRQLELAEQAANGVYSVTQRRALNSEAEALTKEYNRIVASTDFSGLNVLKAGDSSNALRLQFGYGTDGGIALSLTSQLAMNVGDATFGTPTTVASYTGLRDVATGDFNGDGKADFVTADYSAKTIFISYGNGDGTFAAKRTVFTFAPNQEPTGVSVADLNGDGLDDLIVSGDVMPQAGSGGASILMNNGNGTFSRTATLSGIGASTPAIVASDFTGDGIIDIALNQDTSVSLYRGGGTGTFALASTFATSNTSNLAAGDMNGDGISDLIAASYYDNTLSIRFGSSSGTFSTALSVAADNGPLAIATGDFNHDGYSDFAVSSLNGLKIYHSNGNGTFSIQTFANKARSAPTLSAVDLNGDGYLDLMGVDDNGSIATFLSNGNGSFGGYNEELKFGGALPGATADFNGDGVADVAAIVGQAVEVALGDSTRTSFIQTFNLGSVTDARAALKALTQQRDRITSELGAIGAAQSRLVSAARTVGAARENYLSAESRIKDADIAEETARYARLQIGQQAATAVLAQANQLPALALALLG